MAAAIRADQAQEAGDGTARGRPAHRRHAEARQQPRRHLAVAVVAHHDANRGARRHHRQHEEAVVPEGDDRLFAALPARLQALGVDVFEAQRGTQGAQEQGQQGRSDDGQRAAQAAQPRPAAPSRPTVRRARAGIH
ncbi:MAG: hypothetical protein U0802_25750 [Candidatus Binatia bacterium]